VRRVRATFSLLALALAAAAPGAAHEVRPAYLQLRELEPDVFEVLWKVPARGEMRLALEVILPEGCVDLAPRARVVAGGAATERWRTRCAGGLVGRAVSIDGLAGTLTDALVRVERPDGTQVVRLTSAVGAFTVAAAPGALEVARSYLGLGVEHIALGVDHLLFVLGLLLLVETRRSLIGAITAFTLAHSVTLAASTLGWVRLAQQPVEAVIALSIVFVAGEIARAQPGHASLTRRWPWLVAASFGLLHGFGFAGALREVGLPEGAIPLALLFFNLGVEIGQLGFVALVLGLGVVARRARPATPAFAGRAAGYGIGSLAAYWTLERVAGFWG
jgi:hypothetical protein